MKRRGRGCNHDVGVECKGVIVGIAISLIRCGDGDSHISGSRTSKYKQATTQIRLTYGLDTLHHIQRIACARGVPLYARPYD